jgi:hypothetical protein
MELENALARLRLADEHIARGLELIERQLGTVHQLKRDGHDAVSAIELLQELRVSLESMVQHRQIIEETIEIIRLRGGYRTTSDADRP